MIIILFRLLVTGKFQLKKIIQGKIPVKKIISGKKKIPDKIAV